MMIKMQMQNTFLWRCMKHGTCITGYLKHTKLPYGVWFLALYKQVWGCKEGYGFHYTKLWMSKRRSPLQIFSYPFWDMKRSICRSFKIRHNILPTWQLPPHWWATLHDEVMKWKLFPCYWSLVWGIHWSLVNSPHKGQWYWSLMFSLISTCANGWVTNQDTNDYMLSCSLWHHCNA